MNSRYTEIGFGRVWTPFAAVGGPVILSLAATWRLAVDVARKRRRVGHCKVRHWALLVSDLSLHLQTIRRSRRLPDERVSSRAARSLLFGEMHHNERTAAEHLVQSRANMCEAFGHGNKAELSFHLRNRCKTTR